MDADREGALRALPSVHALLARPRLARLAERDGHAVALAAAQAALAELREALAVAPSDADGRSAPTREELLGRAETLAAVHAREARRSTLQRVVNATGVVVHTNLGRAPLAREAARAAARTAQGYVTLEYDLAAGTRGSRHVHAERLLRGLTGAEAALVVNNCAAALLLALNTTAEGRAVLVSRGEMIEIGGGFRVHEILAKSGARLVEVGATNKTHLADYAAALEAERGEVAAILKVHRSNFVQSGFVGEVGLADLAGLVRPRRGTGAGSDSAAAGPEANERAAGPGAVERIAGPGSSAGAAAPGASEHAAGPGSSAGVAEPRIEEGANEVALVYDLGSGCLTDLRCHGLPPEPTPADALAAGADLVAFSGDKLLGGPQAGILVGRRSWITRARSNPLTRALRVDKLTLAALEATLRLHLDPERWDRIPVIELLARPAQALREAAAALRKGLESLEGVVAEVVETESRVGGGSLPGATPAGAGVALRRAGWSAAELEARLRAGSPPVVGRIEEERVVLDLRSVPAGELALLARALRRVLEPAAGAAPTPVREPPGHEAGTPASGSPAKLAGRGAGNP